MAKKKRKKGKKKYVFTKARRAALKKAQRANRKNKKSKKKSGRKKSSSRKKHAHRGGGFSMANALKRKQKAHLVHRLLAKGYNHTDAEAIASRAIRKWDAVAKRKAREAAAREKDVADKAAVKSAAFATAWANIGKMAGGGAI